MSNDPKDTVIDWSKLVNPSSNGTSPQSVTPKNIPSMITSIMEGTILIGQENFTFDEKKSNETD